jgi:hypothetical protein
MQQRFVPPPFTSTTRVSDITPQVTITEEFCRRQLTSYEVDTLRKAEPVNNPDFQDIKKGQDSKKHKKGSKRSTVPKPNWQRVLISQEVYDQDVILKKIKLLEKRRSITDKKADLKHHMNIQVNKLLDEKNNFEYDTAFTWTLCQLDRSTVYNKTTKMKETDTLTLYLKRAPRPEANAMVVYQNIERAKLQQNKPPPQQQFQNVQFPPQQRAPSQGPPQGRPRTPVGRVPPPPVQVIHDGPKNGGGKVRGKGDEDDIIHVIETDEPQRRPGGKTVYNKRKSVHYHSDDSRSTRSSQSSSSSGSDSESSSAYSDSETNASSVSVASVNRQRRDSGYARSKGRGLKQHEKGYFMVNKPRRHSSTAYVPDPPRGRAQSYERLSTNPIEVEHRISEAKAEAFAAGFTTASRVAAVDRASVPPARTIMYADDRSQRSSLRSLDEDMRALDDTHAEVLRLENLRLQDDLRLREEANARLREEANARLREEANARLREDVRRFSEAPTREELRLRADLRRAQDTIRQDELASPRMRDPEYLRRGSLSPLSFESMPSPRAREFDYPHRRPLSPVPLEPDMPFQYKRNPFAPRRRDYNEPQYRH